MCGIVGYIGSDRAAPLIHAGLKRLEYRGYDSCGIATLEGGIHLKKGAGAIDSIHSEMNLDDLPGNIGIGHTRWATHGAPSDTNAHPHMDCKNNIAVVHNGIISNYSEIKERLEKRGHVVASETDTEVVAHLIEEYLEDDLEKAVRVALKEIKGTYALLVISNNDPDKIICARNESPLVLGVSDNGTYVASDVTPFLPFTKKAVPLDNREYAVLNTEGYSTRRLDDGKVVDKEVLEIEWTAEMAEKGGYEHFMLKEIHEQPSTIVNAMNIYPQDIERFAEMMNEAERIYITAAGTSLHAAMVGEYWFSTLCGRAVMVVDSSELVNKGVFNDKTLVIAISQSGETYDTLAAMRYAKSRGAKIATIVNVIGSTATREADHVILQSSGIEIAVCATKTFTSQLMVLLRTAVELAKISGNRDKIERIEGELQKLPGHVKEALKLGDFIKEVAREYCTVKNYIYIGKGINLPSALEGALKFKEISYYHAEGMSGGLLKHGTISLIDEDMHTVAFIPWERENRSKIISNIQEVKARKGVVMGVAIGEPVEQCDVNIVAPKCSELLSPIVFAPIYQLLAYYTAVQLGRNVDKPRALAKSVTVE